MSYIPDNLDLFERYDGRAQDEMDLLPVCDWCGEPIQDEQCYKLDGDVVCEHCMDALKVYTTDLMG